MSELDDKTLYFKYFKDRWKALVATVLAVFVIVGLPAMSVTQFADPGYGVQAIWPKRLSADAPSTMAIALRDGSKITDLSGKATLYYGWVPDRGNFARALDNGEFEELASTSIDEHGIGLLKIPATGSPKAERPEHQPSPSLLLRVEADGHERWVHHTIDDVDAPVLAVTLDRPLYQPGQTIKMRALVASSTTGKPLNTTAKFVVRDPKSNLVMDEEIETGPNGVAATELVLADRCLQGEYRVEVSSGGQQRTEVVDVRPFRLPRFKVVVTPESPEARPGETLNARVIATYTYGEPVAEADVAVSASAGSLPLPEMTGKTDSEGGFDIALEIPRNARAGASIQIDATVTSVAGRAERGQGAAAVAGRSAIVEVVPAGEAAFVNGRLQRAFIIVKDSRGQPLEGAEVELIIPETAGERTVDVQTDTHGRAPFNWTLDVGRGSYVTVKVVYQGAVLFKQNVHVDVGSSGTVLELDRVVASVGDTMKVAVSTAQQSGALVLVRDGVPLGATKVPAGAGSVEIEIPANAAGFVTVALLREGHVLQQAPLWVRQRGGDTVDITLDQQEYRPGTQAKVNLEFPAPEGSGDGDVTFGLVGVDEALYALKERAGVPLYVLMRRAPTSIFSALAAFDGVDQQDTAGWEIATHRFRATLQGQGQVSAGASDVTRSFVRYERATRLHLYMWLCFLCLLVLVVQMGRWTRDVASKDAFSWRRVGAQVAFGVLCGVFAFALAAADEEMLAGGLAVWMFIVLCWLVAAAVKSPGLNFGRWMLAHVLGVALLGAMAICMDDLRRGDAAGLFILQAGIALPALLAAVQWLVWSFVLMREGHTKPGLAIGSFIGVFLFGGLGATFFVMGSSAKFDEASPMTGGLAMRGNAPEPSAQRFVEFEEAPAAKPSPMKDKDDAGGGAAAPRVRSWFPETMVWLPEIAATGGKAEVNVELPDSITTWRLNAWANTSDGRFGQGQAQLLAIQPYFLQLDVPLEVIDGDEFEVPVTLVNRSKQELEVDFAADTQGPLALRGSSGGSSVLQPGERSIIWIRLDAVGVGDATVTVSSSSATGEGDAVARNIRVKPDGRVLREASSGIIGKGWETQIDVPRDAIENTRFGEVRLFASLVADALGGLDSMLRSPTGCFEQTSSANYPNVMVLRAMRDMKPADWPDGVEDFAETHARATRLVRIGYQRILTFQKPSGGFALYPDRDAADIMLTAYGIMQLVWASDVTSVDQEVIARAARWLVAQQNDDGSWAPRRGVSGSASGDTDVGLLRSTAFVVMALAATKDAQYRTHIDKALVRIEDRLESVESTNALAYVVNALADAGSKKLAIKAADQLAALATREGDLAWWGTSHPTWTYGYGVYASRETTALATQALLATESQTELLQPALNWIARGRGSYGGWGSTQATVWTLRALETLRSKGANDATLRFYFGAEQLPTVQGATELQVTKAPQPLRQFSFVPSSNEGQFVVDSSAETAAMVQLVTEYAVDWDSRFAQVDGEPFGGELELAERRTQRGATTRAYARIENLLETDARMVIIEAPVPPGAFVTSDALDELQQNGAIDMYEILPTHIRFYVDRIEGKKERVFAYDFIPLVRGTFSLPPLRAYPYYSPEPVTEVDAGDLRTE